MSRPLPRRTLALASAGALAIALVVPDALSAPPKGPTKINDLWPSPPTRYDGGTHDAGKDASRPADDGFKIDKTPPDPKPIVTRERYLFDLRWREGNPRLVGVTRADTEKPEPSARVFGRFALELFEGTVLVERVRFDFPMLDEPSDPKAVDLQKKLSTRIGVYFPRTSRGTRLELFDRATERRWALPWPAQ